VPPALKERVYRSYGVGAHRPGAYEIDHLVALSLGSSNAQANLWPQPAPAYRLKDAIEAQLARAVCTHEVRLAAAQRAIAADWQSAPARLHLSRP
jgi:hypothetical protein